MASGKELGTLWLAITCGVTSITRTVSCTLTDFLGYPCASYNLFQEGKCFPCPEEGCPNMGHYADRFKNKIKDNELTKFYLNTKRGPKVLILFGGTKYL
uniref:Putative phospholipase n=1 Tax=Ixodes ricinus TaxID=34613 RepID=A0A0K8R520_IXORI